jgi:3-keto-5-aminohexanoate cleavage enzyme
MRRTADQPVILTAALTGGGPPRARAPWQPASTEEIVAAAIEAEALGATILHLHARDDATGATTTEPC